MKKLFLSIVLVLALSVASYSQRVVWEDDFETSKGWSEYEDKDGSALVKDGVFLVKSKGTREFITKCKTNVDINKNFTITADANVKDGLKEDQYIGMAVDFMDNKNFSVFLVEKGFVWFFQFRDGNKVREDKEYIKPRSKKDQKMVKFELQRKGSNIMFLVNDEETIETKIDKIESNRIGFYVSGGQEVSFDNVKIMQ